MRRTLLVSLVVGGIALPFLGAGQAPSRSDRKPLPAPTNSIAPAKVSPLPITQVIIFNSGVALGRAKPREGIPEGGNNRRGAVDLQGSTIGQRSFPIVTN